MKLITRLFVPNVSVETSWNPLGLKFVAFGLLLIVGALLSPQRSYATATRYQITAPSAAPVGTTTYCSGDATSSYTNQANKTSCTIIGSATSNTITWQWVYDGTTNITGASGTFVVGSGAVPVVTLTSAQSAVLSTLSPGTHTLQCKYTPAVTDCGGTAGVPVISPALTITINGPGAVTASGGGTYCGTANISASGGSGGTIYYQGTTSGGTSTAFPTTNAAVTTTGTYYFRARTAGGCWGAQASVSVVVNPVPAPLSGTASVCQLASTTLSHAIAGGTWLSAAPSTATVAGGVVTGVLTGTTGITYTLPTYTIASGCYTVRVVTVIATPVAITGTQVTCTGSSTTLTNTDGGGIWSSDAPTIASVTGAGVVAGITCGVANISYTFPNGCATSVPVTVNPSPVVTITPGTSATVCAGSAANFTASSPTPVFSLLNQDFNSGTGSWTITNGTGSAASYWQLVTPPGGFGIPGDGTQMLQAAAINFAGVTNTVLTSPSFTTQGGYDSVTLTFNQHIVSSGATVSSIQYSVSGGPWQTIIDQVIPAAGIGTGSWSATTPEFSMKLPADAVGFADVRLRWVYNANLVFWYLDNISVKGTLPPPTYTWSGTLGLSCTSCASTSITPIVNGANAYSITVSNSVGCSTGNNITVSVNPLPATITGNLTVCEGNTNTLTSTTGGSWASSDPAVATIHPTTGAVSGIVTGTATISYTLSTGCQTTSIATVIPAPSATTGTASVCVGLTTALANATAGGTWSSSATGIATVSTFGVVAGLAQGNANISYTLPSGCTIFREVTVNPLPAALTGTQTVCKGVTTVFGSATLGGTWTTDNSTIATVDGSGVISGLNTGNTTIRYTLPTSCVATREVTVNPIPADIVGVSAVCQGASTVMTNATSGGTWLASSAVASIDLLSGTVTTGAFTGNVTISYVLTATGCYTVHPLTVNEVPANITGIMDVCRNSTTLLTNATAGGSWTSGATGTLSIDAASGIATGVNAGTANVTYTLPTTCRTVSTVTVNPLPGFISGTTQVCVGLTTTLSNATANGLWTSSDLSVATVSTAGVVAGIAPGTATIEYTLPTGCLRAVVVTVNALPADITGIADVCPGNTTLLENADPGGTWNTDNASVATISGAGLVMGVSAGTTLVTYTLPTSCITTREVTVNPLPSVITGTATVCEGLTTTFSSATMGGVWSSEDVTIADVSPTGVVEGIDAGSTNIVYTNPATGCIRRRAVTVNPTPDAFTGALQACPGFTTTLSSVPTNGTWVADNLSVAIINAAGEVTAVAAGTSAITYTLPEGCRTIEIFTTNPLPAAITGSRSVCIGSTSVLSNSSIGGTWTAANTAIGTIDVNTGLVGGIAQGTTLVTYTLPTTCSRTATVTINPLPGPITGALNVCQGSFTTLSNGTPGGTWSSNLPAIAPVSAAGVVSGSLAGTAVISYVLPTSCRSVASVVVNPLPANITGTTTLCALESSILSNTTPGGVWASSNDAVAAADATGTVSANSAGNAVISYSLPTGCYKTVVFVVNPLPGLISGNLNICQGTLSALSNALPGGTWASSNVSVAAVSATGLMTGMSQGSSQITYTLPSGCNRIATAVINPLPEPITGTLEVCAGKNTLLESATPGGTWSAASMAAMVNASGWVTGVAAGTTTISYTIGNNCKRTAVVTINALPGLLLGAASICPGTSTILTNVQPGGTWTVDNSLIASVDAATGLLTGNTPGTALITYALPNGCQRSRSILVHNPVAPIGGTTSVCSGSSTTLTNAVTGGVWTSNNISVAPIGAGTGTFTGGMPGSATITYTLPSGCRNTTSVVVDQMPGNITGAGAVCEGSTISLGSATAGGSWTGSNDAIATISPSGVVSGISSGSVQITYALSTGCSKTRTINVNALPVVHAVTGGGNYCSGGTGVAIGLDASQVGISYELTNGTTTLLVAGTGDPLDFGLQTNPGTYVVSATSTQGCVSDMTGSAVVVVNDLVTPGLAMTTDMGTRVCAGTMVTYTAIGTNGGTTPAYVWSVNGTNVGAATSYAYVPADGDVVMASMTSSAACASPATVSDMKAMTVITKLTPAVSIVVAPNDTVCEGSTAAFFASATNGGSAPVYTWIVGGSIVPGVSGPAYSFIPANGQTVVCRLNSDYECPLVNDVQSNMITMKVDTKYVPAVSIIAQQGTVVAQGQQVDFSTFVTNAGPSPRYQWMINSTFVTGATSSAYTTSTLSDGDSVSCIVYGTSPCGLITRNTVIMKVTPATGIVATANNANAIRLLPNPNNGSFVISGETGSLSDQPVLVEVTNILGQVVYRNMVQTTNGHINENVNLVGSVANGMYMLNISAGDERRTFRFVISQ